MSQLQNKVAIVTGGAAGIGAATVALLAGRGASVVFSDWHAEQGQATEAALSQQGLEVVFVHAQAQLEADALRLVEQAQSRFGGVDILVNNAGIRKYQTVVEASEESWDEILGVNLKGYAFAAKAAIPAMAAGGGGSIINIASVRSVVAGSKTVQYDTTKAAILGLTRAMARDHAAEGIRVNAVGPGPVYTDFHRQRAQQLGQSEQEYIDWFGIDTLLKRPGKPEEIAKAIAFLASDDASYVTGTCLFVDGGLIATAERD